MKVRTRLVRADGRSVTLRVETAQHTVGALQLSLWKQVRAGGPALEGVTAPASPLHFSFSRNKTSFFNGPPSAPLWQFGVYLGDLLHVSTDLAHVSQSPPSPTPSVPALSPLTRPPDALDTSPCRPASAPSHAAGLVLLPLQPLSAYHHLLQMPPSHLHALPAEAADAPALAPAPAPGQREASFTESSVGSPLASLASAPSAEASPPTPSADMETDTQQEQPENTPSVLPRPAPPFPCIPLPGATLEGHPPVLPAKALHAAMVDSGFAAETPQNLIDS